MKCISLTLKARRCWLSKDHGLSAGLIMATKTLPVTVHSLFLISVISVLFFLYLEKSDLSFHISYGVTSLINATADGPRTVSTVMGRPAVTPQPQQPSSDPMPHTNSCQLVADVGDMYGTFQTPGGFQRAGDQGYVYSAYYDTRDVRAVVRVVAFAHWNATYHCHLSFAATNTTLHLPAQLHHMHRRLQ